MLRRRQVDQKRRQAVYNRKPASVATVKKIVNNKLNKTLEKKYWDKIEMQSGRQPSWVAPAVSISDIGQGDTDISRDGDKFKFLSYAVDGFMKCGSGADYFVRVTIIRYNEMDDDLSVNGGPKVLGDLVYQSNAVTGDAAMPTCPFNFDQLRAGTFTILKDKKFYVLGAASASEKIKKISLRGKINSSVDFKSGTIIGKGKLYMLLSTGLAANPDVTPTFFYSSRVKFTDA